MGDLVAVREQLMPALHTIEPIIEQLLPPTLPPEKLMQTLIVSVANNPTLARASRPSLLQAAVSAAVLGLEVDGVSGQGYVVPYKSQAQFLTGYKGMVTIAARSHRTLEGFVILDGDRFRFNEMTGEVLEYERELGNEPDRRLVAAVAVSRAHGFPQQLRVLSLDQILAVREKSAGWRAKREKSTWGTNFDAMARKTPMRRMANDLPVLGLHQAEALDTMHDLGRHAYLHQDGGLVVNGKERDPTEVVREVRERDEVEGAQPSAGEILEGEVVEHRTEPGPWTIDWGDGVHRDSRGPARFLEQLERGLGRAIAAGDKDRAAQVTASCRERVLPMMGTQHDPAVSRVLSMMDSIS